MNEMRSQHLQASSCDSAQMIPVHKGNRRLLRIMIIIGEGLVGTLDSSPCDRIEDMPKRITQRSFWESRTSFHLMVCSKETLLCDVEADAPFFG